LPPPRRPGRPTAGPRRRDPRRAAGRPTVRATLGRARSDRRRVRGGRRRGGGHAHRRSAPTAPVRTLLVGLLLALDDDRPAQLTRAHQALVCLPAPDQARLGVVAPSRRGPHLLTYRQAEG